MRADSQYLLMEEDGLDGGAAGEIRTELGVVTPDAAYSSGSPHSMQNYSLDDPEEPPQASNRLAAGTSLAKPLAAERESAPSGGSHVGPTTIDIASEREDVKMMKGVEKSDA